MDSPLASYKYYVKKYGLFGAQKRLYEFFRQKYFVNAPNNAENSRITKKIGFFVPGRLYTYRYDPKYKNILDWYDTRPIMLSIRHFKAKTTGNLIETGINIHFLPPNIRVICLQALYNVFKPLMESNQATDERRHGGQQRPLFTESYDYMEVLDWIFETVSHSAYRFAIRNYIKTRMKNVKAISYSDFGKSTLIESRETVGATIEEIYKKYWDYKISQKNRETKLREQTKKYIKKRTGKDISRMRKRK